MQDIRQTKEGFIKSMILFFVLLGICFAPFIAFSQTIADNANHMMNEKAVVSEISAVSKTEFSQKDIHFDLSLDNSLVQVSFNTTFKCAGYAIEGKTSGSDEYVSLLYCHSNQCVDTRNAVTLTLDQESKVYEVFRVKTTLENGSVIYSEEKNVAAANTNKVSLVNTAVNEKLQVSVNDASEYTYSIMSIKGENICSGEQLGSEGVINFSNQGAGFYIISFKSLSGAEYHYKFFKTVNL